MRKYAHEDMDSNIMHLVLMREKGAIYKVMCPGSQEGKRPTSSSTKQSNATTLPLTS